MTAFHPRAPRALALIAVLATLIPGLCLADWVERQQPLAHAVFVPAKYESGKQYPLVMVLHGNGGQGHDNRTYKNEFYAKHLSEAKIQEETPHFIYAPQCPAGQTWVDAPWDKGSYSVDKVGPSQAMTKLTNILTGLLKEFNIDKDRIYVIGISMGGQATWDLLCRHPTQFAGAVPICGCGDPSKAGLLKGVGIWAFHGTEDHTVPAASDREMIENLEKAGLKVLRLTDVEPSEPPRQKHIYSEYKMDHNVWDKAIGARQHLVPWLFSQSRATGSSSAAKPGLAAETAAPAEKAFVAGGATLRRGMTKAEVMAQMAQTPAAGWFVQDLDSPPTPELYKMDQWTLAYKNADAALPGGSMVTLIFVDEKISEIKPGGGQL